MDFKIVSVKEVIKTFKTLLRQRKNADDAKEMETINDNIDDFFLDVVAIYGYSFNQAREMYRRARRAVA